jgi:HTH-type transcriptional regulator/antitoxin HigA
MSSPEPEELVPDWSLHPGVVLRHVLEERGIRQSELAERTGLTAKHINQLVNQDIGISGDVALLLERALPGFDARFWTRTDAYHQAYLSKEKARGKLPELTAWADGFDPATLRHHGITSPHDNQATTVEKILQFFGVATPEAFEQTWMQPRVSFRRSQAFTVAEQNSALWLRLLERSAEQITVAPFRAGALRKAARIIPPMTNLTIPDGFTAARAALAQAGVVLTFIRQVPGTRICGATWWLAADRPVIGLTERHRKPDIFWFNLLHEIGHIALHPRRTTFLDLDLDKSIGDTAEQQADAFAESTLLPGDARTRIARATSREELLLLAATLGIGVTIVAGQHGHATGQWNIGGTLRGKITDADIGMLEALSPHQDKNPASAPARRSRFTAPLTHPQDSRP